AELGRPQRGHVVGRIRRDVLEARLARGEEGQDGAGDRRADVAAVARSTRALARGHAAILRVAASAPAAGIPWGRWMTGRARAPAAADMRIAPSRSTTRRSC